MNIPLPTGIDTLDTILPREPLLMMGAGPVPIPHRVAHANSIVINHLGDVMNKVIEQVKGMAPMYFRPVPAMLSGWLVRGRRRWKWPSAIW